MKKSKAQQPKTLQVIEWLNTGMFSAIIMFSMNFSYEKIIKELKKKKADDWLLGISGERDKELINGGWVCLRRDIENLKTGKFKTLFYISLNTQFDFSDYDYSKLAHEIVHAIQFVLPDFLDRNKEIECEAYLHTHIMMQCLKAIRGN